MLLALYCTGYCTCTIRDFRADGIDEWHPHKSEEGCRVCTDSLACRYKAEKLPDSFEASYAGKHALPSDKIVTLIESELWLLLAKMQIMWSRRDLIQKKLRIAEIEEKQVTLLMNPDCSSSIKFAEQ